MSQIILGALFASKHTVPLWREPFVVPAYVAALSAIFVLLHLIFQIKAVRKLLLRKKDVPNGVHAVAPVQTNVHAGLFSSIKASVESHAGWHTFTLRVLHLLSCLALLGISIAAFVLKEENAAPSSFVDMIELLKKKKHHGKKGDKSTRGPAIDHAEWIELVQSIFFLYTSLLALLVITLSSKPLRRVLSWNLTIVLLVMFGVYFVRDFVPLTTIRMVPVDVKDGWLTWSRLVIVTVAAVVIPSIIPYEYIPLDPANPNGRNDEQTASLFSFATFSFLDSIVWTAWKHPHLEFEMLPALADYDRASVLRDRAFRYMDPSHPQVKKRRHMAWNFLILFRKAFIWQAIYMFSRTVLSFLSPLAVNYLLKYLEAIATGTPVPEVRPWVWILALFLSPILGSILLQLYIFSSTGNLARTEAILTQLIFEHALRIRMKEDAPAASESAPPSRAETPAGGATPVKSTIELPEDDAVEGASASASGTLVDSTATVVNTDEEAAETKKKAEVAAAAEKEAQDKGSNLTGRLNSLISTDMDNIVEARDFMFVLVQAPVTIILGVVFLYLQLGWAAFVGMGFMVLGLWLPGKVATLVHKVQISKTKATDARVQAVTETLNVLRMVKMFGWENKVIAQTRAKREYELGWVRKRMYLNLLNNNLNYILPLITMIMTYVPYTLIMKKPLTASIVFSSLTVFDAIRDQLHFVFWSVPAMIQGKVSFDRVDAFLWETELLDQYARTPEDGVTATDFLASTNLDSEDIGFHNATFTWSATDSASVASTPGTPGSGVSRKRKFVLRCEGDITFKRNQLNIIVGPTGSGKTSLLLALLGELHFVPEGPDSSFNLPRQGGVAYAAQEPWIMNETIKENILFGQPYDEQRYKQTLNQCSLDRDLTLFNAGDNTEVGEKGLTLSGGQKARVALARAVYSNAEIVLLDDVLSALDVHTARFIVEKCLSGDLLKNRTVILVTHNVAMAGPIAKNVVSIGTDGTISRLDSIGEALSSNKALLEEVAHEQEALAKADEVADDSKIAGTEQAPADENAVKAVDGEADAIASGKLIAEEEVALGRVDRKSMMLYLSSMGGPFFWTGIIGLLLGSELFSVLLSWWLGHWADQYNTQDPTSVNVPFYLGMYILLVVLGVLDYTGQSVVWVYGTVRASRRIHERLVQTVLSTTLRWLDKTPIGRIIARFTKDIRAIDGSISNDLSAVLEITAHLLMRLVAIVSFTPLFLVPGLAFGIVGWALGTVYIAAQLSVKREMSNAKAPVFGHFAASMSGLTSIRAYGVQDKFKNVSMTRIDKYTRAGRSFYNLNRWIGVRIDTFGGMFSAGLAWYLVYNAANSSASKTGFLLNMAVAFTGILIWWVRCLNDLEVEGNSLERIQSYLDIEQEPKSSESGKPPAAWPTSGKLVIDNLTAKYSVDGPEVLHNLNFTIESGEKVGVVGRTGSGKSSLTLSLLRLIPTGGQVLFDGIPTHSINLEDLRSSVTIIPQQPELLAGTIRNNLDPFDEHDDSILNDALRSAGLFSLQQDLPIEERISLESTVSSGGGNFSLGQRQILALARALVRQSKVLILDEATASLDHETDALVQQSLGTEFKECTLITVAHRLQTVMNSDKILVLDAGNLVEFDSPRNLLAKKDGAFKSLVEGSGNKEDLYALLK